MEVRPLTIRAKGFDLSGAAFFPEPIKYKPLILCHGLPRGVPDPQTDAADSGYPGLARSFAGQGFPTVIFNFRGTGESGGSLELGFWPDDLIAVLDCLDAHESLCSSKYAVLGFSAGGAAAIFAGARDDRIDTLVAAAVPADFDFLGLAGREQQYFDYYRGLGMIRPDYPGDAKAWAHNFNMLQSKNAMGDVRAKNVCLMHGGKDDTVPFAHMETLAALCPTNVRQIALPNSGHQLRCESVAVRAMLDYLMKTAKKAES